MRTRRWQERLVSLLDLLSIGNQMHCSSSYFFFLFTWANGILINQAIKEPCFTWKCFKPRHHSLEVCKQVLIYKLGLLTTVFLAKDQPVITTEETTEHKQLYF